MGENIPVQHNIVQMGEGSMANLREMRDSPGRLPLETTLIPTDSRCLFECSLHHQTIRIQQAAASERKSEELERPGAETRHIEHGRRRLGAFLVTLLMRYTLWSFNMQRGGWILPSLPDFLLKMNTRNRTKALRSLQADHDAAFEG